MIKIHGKEYIEVNERLIEFWQGYPEGSVITEVLKIDDNFVMIKAEIRKTIEQKIPDAVGHAFENKDSSKINQTSYVENCETSAIGRALGVLGYGIKTSIASAEEVTQAIEQQGDNKASTHSTKAVKMGDAKVTEEQFNYLIKELEANRDFGDKGIQYRQDWLCKELEITKLSDLLAGRGQEAIDLIKQYIPQKDINI